MSTLSQYKKKKRYIKARLRDFDKFHKADNRTLFAELAFCLLTPQSKAVSCDKAVSILKDSDLLFNGSEGSISSRLKGLVRFHNKKSAYLVNARKALKNGKGLVIKDRLENNTNQDSREWLVEKIKGLGYKEASHFLRNIGLGQDIAILDVHILKNLKRLKVIKETPVSMTRNQYLKIEDKMRGFSRRVKIPMEELDLLFWSNQTGFIFK